MKTTHTKGEWKVNIDSGRLSSDQSEVPLASIKIPLRDGLNQWDEMEANAKLIAAAPELLKLLIDLVQYESDEEYRLRCDTLAEEATAGNISHFESILTRAEWIIQKATN